MRGSRGTIGDPQRQSSSRSRRPWRTARIAGRLASVDEEEERRGQSPFVRLIGGRFEEWREGYVRLGLTVDERHTNPHGVMHGGVITTLMDEALGGVIASVRGIDEMRKAPHATVDMNVSFLSNARSSDEIIVEGAVLKLGRSVAFGEAEARRKRDNKLIAKGRFTFAIIQREGT
jgi:uncharacterized protein (TIGR00369 family)